MHYSSTILSKVLKFPYHNNLNDPSLSLLENDDLAIRNLLPVKIHETNDKRGEKQHYQFTVESVTGNFIFKCLNSNNDKFFYQRQIRLADINAY